MAEYIERDLVISKIEERAMLRCHAHDAGTYKHLKLVKWDIADLPAADVVPVRHGRWIWDEDGMDWGIGSWRCSECRARPETWWQGDKSSPYNKSGHYFCPNCGAKMESRAPGVEGN